MTANKETTVFPVLVTKISETKTEKKPLVKDWQSAKTKIHEIDTPNFGVVIPAPMLIVDLDLYKNADLKAQLFQKTGFKITEASLLQSTITGGEHHVFRCPEGDHQFTQGSNLLGIEGFDTRCAGSGFICSGAGYAPVSDNIAQAICSESVCSLPDVLVDALLKPKKRPANVTHIPVDNRRFRVDVNEVESALDFINPDVSYESWVAIGMALQSVPSGLSIWDRWSQGGGKYCGFEQIQRKFETFTLDGGITLGTLYDMASKGGWQRPYTQQEIEGGDASDFAAIPIPNPNGLDPHTLNALSEYAFLTHMDKFYHIKSGATLSVSTFNNAFESTANLRAVDPMTNREKTFKANKFFQTFLKSQVVHMSMYAPQFGTLFSCEGLDWVNSYKPQLVPKSDPNWRSSSCWQIVENHYMRLFESTEISRKLLQWMAFNVQCTGQKVLWAPIICGIQGDGKSSIANILSVAMGSRNVKEIGTGDINSGFNDWAEGAAVVAMEELRVKGHNRHDVMNALKPVISNPRVSVNRKGIGRYDSQNVTNYIAFTNYEDALVLDENDRRWQAFFTNYSKRERLLADFDAAYWDAFHDAYRLNAEVIRGWLMEYDISDFDPTMPPSFPNGNQRMIEASRSEVEAAMLEELEGFGDFFTAKQLVEVLRPDYRGVTAQRISQLLKANDDYQYLEAFKISGKLERIWGCSVAIEKIHYANKDADDYKRALRAAIVKSYNRNNADFEEF